MVKRPVWATRGTGQISCVLQKVIGGGIVSCMESTTRCYPRCRSNPLQLAAWLRRKRCSTPNSMFFGQPNTILQLEPLNIEDTDLRKRAKYLQKCKDAIWRRWTKEYLRSVPERHNLKHGTKLVSPKIGDVVIIKNDERNRGKWQLGIIVQLLTGKDRIVRQAKLRAG